MTYGVVIEGEHISLFDIVCKVRADLHYHPDISNEQIVKNILFSVRQWGTAGNPASMAKYKSKWQKEANKE